MRLQGFMDISLAQYRSETGIQDQVERLQQMAGFRNLLVHGYTEIVAAKVHQNLSHLPDIREYVRAVCEYLDQQES